MCSKGKAEIGNNFSQELSARTSSVLTEGLSSAVEQSCDEDVSWFRAHRHAGLDDDWLRPRYSKTETLHENISFFLAASLCKSVFCSACFEKFTPSAQQMMASAPADVWQANTTVSKASGESTDRIAKRGGCQRAKTGSHGVPAGVVHMF